MTYDLFDRLRPAAGHAVVKDKVSDFAYEHGVDGATTHTQGVGEGSAGSVASNRCLGARKRESYAFHVPT